MSQQVGVLDITLKSNCDLSDKQYYLVKCHTTEGEVVLATALTDVLIGVLQNKPETGQAAVIRVLGTSKVKIGEADMSIGDFVTASASGKAIVTTASSAFIIGTLLETGGSAHIVEMLISRFKGGAAT